MCFAKCKQISPELEMCLLIYGHQKISCFNNHVKFPNLDKYSHIMISENTYPRYIVRNGFPTL